MTTEGDGTDSPPTEGDDDAVDFKAEAEKWKALARKHEAQAKANADKAKKLDELEDSNKSEIQRLTDAAAEATKRAEQAELQLLRNEIGAKKGLTPAQAKRLTGSTAEELEADADDLLAAFAASDDGDDDPADDGDDGNKKPPAARPERQAAGGTDPNKPPALDVEAAVEAAGRIYGGGT